MKGRCIFIPEVLNPQVLDQLHINHMGIDKTKLLAYESIYWASINNNTENYIKICITCLTFQQTQPKEKIIHHDIPIRPWNVIGADMFTLNDKIIFALYIIIANSQSSRKDLSADSLILTCKAIFAEYEIPKRIMSDSGINFISEKFKNFCKSLNLEQAVSSSCHHQNNEQVEACIKFVKCTLKKSFDSRTNPHIALLLIPMTPLEQGLPSPATMLTNHLIRGIMPVFSRLAVGIDNDEYHKALMDRQNRNDKGKDTSKSFVSLLIGSTVAIQ